MTKQQLTFQGRIERLGGRYLIRLPDGASKELSSRGQVAAEVSVAEAAAPMVIEPDGLRGHWLPLSSELLAASGAAVGDAVAVTVVPTKDWPEPDVPDDLKGALEDAPDLTDMWVSLTPMARWEWVRWVKATKNPDTRARRVEVSIDKMRGGKRRPCCFDLSSCTDPELAKSGKLRAN